MHSDEDWCACFDDGYYGRDIVFEVVSDMDSGDSDIRELFAEDDND